MFFENIPTDQSCYEIFLIFFVTLLKEVTTELYVCENFHFHHVGKLEDVLLVGELLLHQGRVRHQGHQDDRVDGPHRDGHRQGRLAI